MSYGYGDRWTEEAVLVAAAVQGRRVSAKGWARCSCPLCELNVGKADKKSSMGVNVVKLRYSCWRCGAKGRLPELPEYAGFELSEDAAATAPTTVDIPEGFCPLDTPYAQDNPYFATALEYLYGRGITDDMIEDFCIGACWDGPYTRRVVVPLLSADGDWLWFTSRSWFKKSKFPYKYPKGDRQNLLYNHSALFVPTDEPLLVVEGVFDALSVAPHGVAVWGSPGETTLWALRQAKRPVAFVLDGDVHEKAWALAHQLRLSGVESGSVRLPPRVDPDEVPRARLLELARACLTCSEVRL